MPDPKRSCPGARTPTRWPLRHVAGRIAPALALLLACAAVLLALGWGQGRLIGGPSPLPIPTPAPTAATLAYTVRAPLETAAPPPPALLSLVRATGAGRARPRYPSYLVGAYYFSGWSHGPNDNISPLLTGHFSTSEPLIGWYDDTQAAVDRSIAQAADAGIDFFAFDWYDVAQSRSPTDRTLNEGLRLYLSSRQRRRLGFCLLFADHAPFLPGPGDWPHLVRLWIRYFKQPGYVRVGGKPLLIVFSPEYMRQIFDGSAGVHAALSYLRARARAAGLPGVTVAVAATVTPRANPIHVAELNAEGYDAATGYDYHAVGSEEYNVPVPYLDLVEENVAMWSRVAARVHVPYIPVITSGFDLRYSARQQRTAIIYAGRSPRQFACYAVLARRWIDTHPRQTTRERIVMLYAWTEIGEGGAIIPDHRYGDAYARAVRTVFGGPGSPPTTPSYCR